MECIVQDCNCSLGIAFPEEPKKRSLWLKALKAREVDITAKSIVCLNHFSVSDILIVYDSDGKGTKMVKKGSVPCLEDNSEKKILFEGIEDMCRICLATENLVYKLTDDLKENITIAIAMKLCCSLKVQPNDGLPQHICDCCFEDLNLAHNLRVRCLETHAKFEMGNYAAIKRKQEQLNEEAALAADQDEKQRSKRPRLETKPNRIPPYKRNYKRVSKVDKTTIKQESKAIQQLATVQDILSALNNDVEHKTNKPVTIPNEVKVGGLKKKEAADKDTIFWNTKGAKDCAIIISIQGFFFIEAEEYLYSFGLLRNNIRILHCIHKKCTATAEHKRIDDDSYEDEILVTVAHNHKPISKMEQKVSIFYHIVKKKLQLDKTINIRNLYDHFCEEDTDIRELLPIRTVFNELCKTDLAIRVPSVINYMQLYDTIELESFARLQFTQTGKQFYQERLATSDDTAHAIVFCNTELVERLSTAQLMFVDASFRMDCKDEETGEYCLVTVLLWVDDSYYPILFALLDFKTPEILRLLFAFLRDTLAPELRPAEIVTGYESSLYFALGETYTEAHIGGCIFYYVQTVYQCLCVHGLNAVLETSAHFRKVYQMLLMLPLLPVNTIQDALSNIISKAKEHDVYDKCQPLFDYVQEQWIKVVTPELFCVHGLETRINENVIAPFKKLRDLLLWCKGVNKTAKQNLNVVQVVEKLVELEGFLLDIYSKKDRRNFGRDLSVFQKKSVLKVWSFIETHPVINVNAFYAKICGYIKCLENQLWIWGFYRYKGNMEEELISAQNFVIPNVDEIPPLESEPCDEEVEEDVHEEYLVDENGVAVDVSSITEENVIEYVEVNEKNNDVDPDYSDENSQSSQEIDDGITTTVVQTSACSSASSGCDMPLLSMTVEEEVVTDTIHTNTTEQTEPMIVMEAVIGQDGQVVLHDKTSRPPNDCNGAKKTATDAIKVEMLPPKRKSSAGNKRSSGEWEYY